MKFLNAWWCSSGFVGLLLCFRHSLGGIWLWIGASVYVLSLWITWNYKKFEEFFEIMKNLSNATGFLSSQ